MCVMFVYVQNCVRVALARTELRMCWLYEYNTMNECLCGNWCLYKTWNWKIHFLVPKCLCKQGTTNTYVIKKQEMSSTTPRQHFSKVFQFLMKKIVFNLYRFQNSWSCSSPFWALLDTLAFSTIDFSLNITSCLPCMLMNGSSFHSKVHS